MKFSANPFFLTGLFITNRPDLAIIDKIVIIFVHIASYFNHRKAFYGRNDKEGKTEFLPAAKPSGPRTVIVVVVGGGGVVGEQSVRAQHCHQHV